MYHPDTHHRRSIRLKKYDYSQEGPYFITVCTQNRESLFGKILEEKMYLNPAGHMIRQIWDSLPSRFPNIKLDEFVIMPNHIHGIIILNRSNEPHSIAQICQAFKSITTNEYMQGVRHHFWRPFMKRLWQRNYWERVIRSEVELYFTREYVQDNPAKWASDKLFSPS